LFAEHNIPLRGDITATNKVIGTVAGLEYTYTYSSQTLIISKDLISVSVVFAISASKATPTAISERVNSALLVDVAKVVESIKLKNTDTDSQLGIRTATITYTDVENNESASATASLKEAQRFEKSKCKCILNQQQCR
jgi:hypothetical protein